MYNKEYFEVRFREVEIFDFSLLSEYIDFCIDHNTPEDYDERHHILPKQKDYFPEFSGFKCLDNISFLSYENHLQSHILLAKALHGNNPGTMWLPVRMALQINENKLDLIDEELITYRKHKELGNKSASLKLKGLAPTKDQIRKRHETMSAEFEINGEITNRYKEMGKIISKGLLELESNGYTKAKNKIDKMISNRTPEKIKEIGANISKSKEKLVEYNGEIMTLGRMASLKAAETMKKKDTDGVSFHDKRLAKMKQTKKDRGLERGPKNPNAKIIVIYNEINQIMFISHGNFNSVLRENGLPKALAVSYRNNGKLIYTNRKTSKFHNWYAKINETDTLERLFELKEMAMELG